MTKALVFYLYGAGNAGDMAICLGTIGFLRRHGVSVSMVSRFDRTAPDYQESVDLVHSYYPDVKIHPGFFKLDRGAGKASLLAQHAVGLAKCLNPIGEPRLREMLQETDLVLFNGGNLLRCAGIIDAARLEALFYPIKLAKRMGKRIICLPQSTAKVGPIWEDYLLRKINYFDRTFIREPASLDKMQERYSDTRFEKSTDMAFFMDDPEGRVHASSNRIAMIVRGSGIGDIGELSQERQDELIGAYIRFAEKYPNYNYTIVVQTKKDRALSDLLLRRLPKGSDLIEEHNAFKLLSIYKSMHATLSMRLHACILSLRAGTPVIGLFDTEWGLKNIGLMHDYGMGYSNDWEGLSSEFERTMGNFDQKKLMKTIKDNEQSLAIAMNLE